MVIAIVHKKAVRSRRLLSLHVLPLKQPHGPAFPRVLRFAEAKGSAEEAEIGGGEWAESGLEPGSVSTFCLQWLPSDSQVVLTREA